MRDLAHDLRFAVRTLRKNRGYALVALVTLMLGIGANTAIFSLVHSVLLHPLPYPEPERLVRVWELAEEGGRMQSAWRNFVDWRARSESFTGLVAHARGGTSTVLGTGAPVRVGVAQVSEGFLRTLGVVPAMGRDFVAEEHRRGADPAVLVSDAFWRTYLGADPELSAHRLEVAGHDARLVGVAPAGFEYPAGVDVWVPLELDEQSPSRTSHNWVVVGRLREDVDAAAAEEELDVITARFLEEDPSVRGETWFEDFFPRDTEVESLQSSLVGGSRRPLWILLGASGLLLLVACTNLASTALARGTWREREIAVRQALGAGRRRVVRLFVVESLVLALAGAALGLGLAWAMVRVVPALAPHALPAFARPALHPVVLAFTLGVAGLTALLFGLFPALGFTRRDFTDSLRSGPRSGHGRARVLMWRGLIAAEVALALVLLVGCGLLIRSFVSVLAVEPGFRTENVLTATISPPATRYPDGVSRVPLYETIAGRLGTLPGVAAVGLVTVPPMGGVGNGLLDVEGGPRAGITADYQLASREYFEAMGVPLLRGRLFDDGDRPETDHVVVVSRALAEAAWPGQDPIGKRMTGGGMDDYWDQEKWATVIGVVDDVRQRELTRPPSPTAYFPYRQRPFRSWSMTAVLRPEGAMPDGLGVQIRDAVRAIDPDVPIQLETIETRVDRIVSERRFTALVLGLFAGVALLLACIGIYGVVAYAVARRTREIGIRIALGARPGSVRRLVQRDTLADLAAGGLVGLVLAIALTRVMRSLLYEVSPTDPFTYAAVVAALAASGWLAAWIPSLRSSRIDPVTTMRAE